MRSLGNNDQIWEKSKSCIPKNIRSPTAILKQLRKSRTTIFFEGIFRHFLYIFILKYDTTIFASLLGNDLFLLGNDLLQVGALQLALYKWASSFSRIYLIRSY